MTQPGTEVPVPPGGPSALELDRAHVFHSWSAQGSLVPLTIVGGKGCELYDDA